DMPTKQYAAYIQDDFRVSGKLTLNLGFRYDLITGMAIDQSKNPNFVILDKAGKAGALAGIEGFEDFGKDPAEDKNNFQGRAGFAYDVRGDGRDVVRAGYGRYYDFGYTNANILFAAVNATGIGAGTVYSVTNSNGISNGRSQYDGVNFGIRRQLRNNFSLNAWYSLSSANGTSGGGTDELSTGNIQDHLHPFGDIQFGPSGRTDARHRINISGIVTIP